MSISSETTNADLMPAGQEANTLEEEDNGQNERDDEPIVDFLLKRSVQAELKHQKLMAEHSALLAKVAEMEQEKQQQQNNGETSTNVWGDDQCKQLQIDQKALLARINALEKQQQMDDFDQQLKTSKQRMENLENFVFDFVDQLSKQQKDQQTAFCDKIDQSDRKQTEHLEQLKANYDARLGNIDEDTIKASIAKISELDQKHTANLDQLKATYDACFARIEAKISTPNWWDVTACHAELTITGPKCLTITQKGNTTGAWRSVFANFSVPTSNSRSFYFEMKVESLRNCVAIGLTTKAMPLDKMVGQHPDSYGYQSNGHFWISNSNTSGKPSVSVGDTVGCGVYMSTREIIFTRNGERLDNHDLFLSSSTAPLFPCVSLFYPGDKIDANFGPIFVFNFTDLEE